MHINKKTFLVLVVIGIWPINASLKRAVIIVHGTFSSGSAWHKRGGDFFNAVSRSFKDHTIDSFPWSGSNSHKKRIAAGKELKQFIEERYDPQDELSIIGHSHGVNVGIIASQELIAHSIEKFYALAPPVNTKHYMPNMKKIKKFHNLFSYGDRIQPVLNSFERVYPKHNRITNTQLTINTLCPEHSSLHHPVVGNYLPQLDDLLFQNKDCVLHLHTRKKPYVAVDATREKDLEIDKRHLEKLVGGLVLLRSGSPHNYLQRYRDEKTGQFAHWGVRFRSWRDLDSESDTTPQFRRYRLPRGYKISPVRRSNP